MYAESASSIYGFHHIFPKRTLPTCSRTTPAACPFSGLLPPNLSDMPYKHDLKIHAGPLLTGIKPVLHRFIHTASIAFSTSCIACYALSRRKQRLPA